MDLRAVDALEIMEAVGRNGFVAFTAPERNSVASRNLDTVVANLTPGAFGWLLGGHLG